MITEQELSENIIKKLNNPLIPDKISINKIVDDDGKCIKDKFDLQYKKLADNVVKSINGKQGDITLTFDDITIDYSSVYVDEVNGLDVDNAGSESYPFKTIKRALQDLQVSKKNITRSQIILKSNITEFPNINSVNCTINGESKSINTEVNIYNSNITFNNTNFNHMVRSFDSFIDFHNCNFNEKLSDSTFFQHCMILFNQCNFLNEKKDVIVCYHGSYITAIGCIIENCYNALWCSNGIILFDGTINNATNEKVINNTGQIFK